MKIKVSFLEKFSYIYVSIPLFIFLVCWLKWWIAIPAAGSLLVVLYSLLKEIKVNEDDFIIRKSYLTTILIICFFWCILSGIGGLYYQNEPDWNMKNAIFHDLINLSYPIVYDNHSALVYYFGIMLPSAVLGKFALFLGFDEYISFLIGNLSLLIYSTIGIFLISLFLCTITKAKGRQVYLVLLIFIFFSGLDVILPHSHTTFLEPIEWHTGFSYSSNTTLLEFVFNQSIVPWLLTCLFLVNKNDVSKYGTLGLFALFFAPLPFIGLCLYFIAMTIFKYLNNKKFLCLCRELFDIKNILSCCVILPILYFYYKSNYLAQNNVVFSAPNIKIISFICCECLVYILILWHRFYKDPIFYVMTAYLILCPLFSIPHNATNDFCMRVSIPSLFILMIFCIKFLFYDTSKEKSFYAYMKIYICIFLAVGSITPIIEFSRGVYYTYIKSDDPLMKDRACTLNNKIEKGCGWAYNIGDYSYYGAFNPEKTVFWKYLAKNK